MQRLERGIYQEESAGNVARAIELYATLVREEQINRPAIAEAMYRLGRCYRRQGDNDRARQALSDVIGRFADQQKYADLARKELAALPEQSAAAVSAGGRQEAEKASQRGWQLWQQRSFQQAETEFQRAVKLDPTNANSWNGLGWSLSNQGKTAEAVQAFETCVRLETKHAAGLNGLGWCAYMMGRQDEAIAWWEKAVAASPTATAAWSGLAKVRTQRREYAKAVEACEKWLEADPSSADAKALMEQARSLSGQKAQAAPRAAENHLPGAGSAAPGGASPSGQVVTQCEERMKKLQELVSSGNTYWLDKKDIADVYTAWAKNGATQDQKLAETAAVKVYLAQHAADPLYAWRLNHLLAVAALDLGRADEAAQYYDAALAAYPDTKYAEPNKQSKYQHLLNERAKLILEKDGPDAAEKYLLDHLATDAKCGYLYTSFVYEEYCRKGMQARMVPFLQQAKTAYAARKQRFPDKTQQVDKYLQGLDAEVRQYGSLPAGR